MTFSFNEMVINDLELNSETYKVIPNFIGYLNPNGIPIKYDTPFGLGGRLLVWVVTIEIHVLIYLLIIFIFDLQIIKIRKCLLL